MGDGCISLQRDIVARLELSGHDSRQASNMLRQFELAQEHHMADRERLLLLLQK